MQTTGEDCKVRVRNVRREYNELLKGLERESEISEDDLRRGLERVQTLTDRYVGLVDKAVEQKEVEINEV